ncbi:MAG: hypothetical protein ABSD71_13765 [Bacteroidales bacterium]|jgi:hypothetical protein
MEDQSGQVRYVTVNRTTKEGGEIIQLKDAYKCSVKTIKGEEVFPEKRHFQAIERVSKDPRHWSNSTRNILLLNGQKRNLHIRLIIELLKTSFHASITEAKNKITF